LHRESTLKLAVSLGRTGIGLLLLAGTALGAGIVPIETPFGVDLLLAAGAAASVGAASWLGTALQAVAHLPLQIAPVASRGQSGGHPVYRFRAQLGRGRTLTGPVATVTWHPASGSPVELSPWLPAETLCGPFTILARDPARRVEGEGHFVVRLQVRSSGEAWSAEQRIPVDRVTEGPFDGVQRGRHGVRFTEAWQRVTAPLESHPVDD